MKLRKKKILLLAVSAALLLNTANAKSQIDLNMPVESLTIEEAQKCRKLKPKKK
jgi:hypothetical protein